MRNALRSWGVRRTRTSLDRGAAPSTFDFALPDARCAHEPPEVRSGARDAVRLMVSRADGAVEHTRFRALPRFLARGDVLVVNASATRNAALPARRTSNAQSVALHLSTPWPGGRWIIELRRPTGHGSGPLLDAQAGERIALPDGATATLLEPFAGGGPEQRGHRLWLARLATAAGVRRLADAHGSPIRYGYVTRPWPIDAYQTVFARVPGSAEMPSAGRPFTTALVEQLKRNGVRVAPIVLHTGVSSLDAHELPHAERFRVPERTALAVNRARAAGRRVVAVGTSVVRAIESVASPEGLVSAGRGWTDLVVHEDRPPRAIDALITGLHAPRASHLAMLIAIAGRAVVERAYEAALDRGYLWHEFGDSHLILRR